MWRFSDVNRENRRKTRGVVGVTKASVENSRFSQVSPGQPLLIVLTADLTDGGRKAALAFGVALSALSTGAPVHVFLTLESAVLGAPSGALGLRPRGFSEPLSTYIEHFLDLGGRLEVCSSCYEEYCRDLPKDEGGRPRLHPGTAVYGLAIVAERAASMNVLTF
jgi:predicted peroxiredoxin